MNEMKFFTLQTWSDGVVWRCAFYILIHTTYTILQFIALHYQFRVASVWHPIVALRLTLKSEHTAHTYPKFYIYTWYVHIHKLKKALPEPCAPEGYLP